MTAERSNGCPYHGDHDTAPAESVTGTKHIDLAQLLPLSDVSHAARVFPDVTDHMMPYSPPKARAIRHENREQNRVLFPDSERARTSSFNTEQRLFVSALAATWTAALKDSLAEIIITKLGAKNGTLLKTHEFQVLFVDSVFEVLQAVVEESPALLYPLKGVIMEMAEASGLRELTDRIDFFRLRRDLQNGKVSVLWSAKFGDVYQEDAFWVTNRQRVLDEQSGETKEYSEKVRCPFQPVTLIACEEFLVALQVVSEAIAAAEVMFEIDDAEFLYGSGRTTSKIQEKAKKRSSSRVTDWERQFLNMSLAKKQEEKL